jgi:hypothetical protein
MFEILLLTSIILIVVSQMLPSENPPLKTEKSCQRQLAGSKSFKKYDSL